MALEALILAQGLLELLVCVERCVCVCVFACSLCSYRIRTCAVVFSLEFVQLFAFLWAAVVSLLRLFVNHEAFFSICCA